MTSSAPAAVPAVPPVPAIVVPSADTAPKKTLLGANDPVWEQAARIDRLTSADGPEAAAHPPLPTEVRLLWSADRLFIRFVCQGGDAHAPFGNQWGAPHYQGDVVEVFLDPVGDAREFIELEVSPQNGILSNLYLGTAEATSRPNGVLSDDFLRRDEWTIPNWSIAGLETNAAIHPADHLWTVVIALPALPLLRRLGQSQFTAHMTLHANFVRYDYAPDSKSPLDAAKRTSLTAMNWSPVPWGRPHRAPARMGTLTLAASKQALQKPD